MNRNSILAGMVASGLCAATAATAFSLYHQAGSSLTASKVDEMYSARLEEFTKINDYINGYENRSDWAYDPGSGVTLRVSNDTLLEAFKEAGYPEEKAYGLLACYRGCTESGLSAYETLGLLGCASVEGCPGVVQGGFKLKGYGTSGSSYDDYIRINTPDKVKAWSAEIINERGCGTAQWTDLLCESGEWSYRGKTYVEKFLSKYVTDDGCDYKTLWKADYDMYKYELSDGYKAVVAFMRNHNSSLESIVVFSYFKYEAGWGGYKDSDSVSSYSGRHLENLTNRKTEAEKIEKVFRKKGILK